MHIRTQITSAALLLVASAFPAYADPLIAKEHGLMCPTYSAVAEANAASAAQDQAWFNKTGCFFSRAGEKIYLVRNWGDVREGQLYRHPSMAQLRCELPGGCPGSTELENMRVFFRDSAFVTPCGWPGGKCSAEQERRMRPLTNDVLLKHLEDKPPQPAAFDNLLKNLTRQQLQ